MILRGTVAGSGNIFPTRSQITGHEAIGIFRRFVLTPQFLFMRTVPDQCRQTQLAVVHLFQKFLDVVAAAPGAVSHFADQAEPVGKQNNFYEHEKNRHRMESRQGLKQERGVKKMRQGKEENCNIYRIQT